MDDNFSAQLLFYFQNKKAFEYEANMAHIYLCNDISYDKDCISTAILSI